MTVQTMLEMPYFQDLLRSGIHDECSNILQSEIRLPNTVDSRTPLFTVILAVEAMLHPNAPEFPCQLLTHKGDFEQANGLPHQFGRISFRRHAPMAKPAYTARVCRTKIPGVQADCPHCTTSIRGQFQRTSRCRTRPAERNPFDGPVKAANLIGDGFYGVDVKEVGETVTTLKSYQQ
ncbi:hypothetical protein Poly41_67760 [Novipirellula artificiosorum]|uniref:Uncharacterized protein n=2 Tax=Novipirellula artificiosorum TaxID=2528016 RepID=A0A5C6CZZ9_9BACT|nr:hypothetical protein Poly41_67760 [Novipirellula artificiosorum]